MISNSRATVVITMAGMGQRFRNVGYKVPKYQIEAHDHSLFYWALTSLRSFYFPASKFVFIVRAEDCAQEFIRYQCDKLSIKNFAVVELDHLTDGQATSAMYAKDFWDNDVPLVIYNIDTFVQPRAIGFPDFDADGWIPCFAGNGDHWSFVKVNESGFAVDVQEKVRISPHATLGLYWFKSASIFEKSYKEYYLRSSEPLHKERYVAPLYNQMIKAGMKVTVSNVRNEDIYPLGTPEELDLFLKNTPPKLN